MSLELHLRIAGCLLLFLAALHVFFPKRFGWREELPRLSLLNRQIFLVHTFFICCVLVFMGALSAFGTQALLAPSPLARWVLAFFATFWTLRLIFQLFVYDSKLWRGDRFNTAMHVLFSTFWTYLATLYWTALLRQI